MPDPGRSRADLLVAARGLAPSRARAQALIAAGKVLADGAPVTRAGQMLAESCRLELAAADHPWVSRGALKLVAALDRFAIDPTGLDGLDLGASTGGFTHVLLDRGAARVTAVDVGHDQLHPDLRADPRVTCIEGLNARDLAARHLPAPPDIVVCDVSFIGLRLALPPALDLAAPGARLVALVKPQFEAGPERVGKGGVVRDPAIREEVLRGIVDWLAARPGWRVRGTVESPVTGPKGNVEYLLVAEKTA